MARRLSLSTLVKGSLLLLLVAAVIDAAAAAEGRTGSPSSAPDPAPAAIPEPMSHVPFTPWSEQPDPIRFESQPVAEQDALMRQSEWAETNAPQIAAAWSRYSHESADSASGEIARRLAGLNGTDDIGVAP